MLTQLERASLRAEREYHLARAAFLDEQLTGHTPPTPNGTGSAAIDLSRFDSGWKTGVRLSVLGEAAILAAYDKFMSQSDVRFLFQISPTAAHNWHEKWKKRRQTSSALPQPAAVAAPV